MPGEQFRTKLKWFTAIKSGFMVGALFLLLPFGSPWSAMSFSSGAIMGRAVAMHGTGQTAGKIALHLLLAVAYAILIAAIVKRLRSWRAILMGAGAGLALYALNRAFVALAFPQLIGFEGRVVFTHIVFGLFAAALYKGMARGPQMENRPA